MIPKAFSDWSILCWYIWKARCSRVFEGIHLNPLEVSHRITHEANKYQKAPTYTSALRSRTDKQSWKSLTKWCSKIELWRILVPEDNNWWHLSNHMRLRLEGARRFEQKNPKIISWMLGGASNSKRDTTDSQSWLGAYENRDWS